jgi:DNA-binding PadR family transcriptional regulator
MTGYDLKTFFKNSVNFFWSAELSQIYRELAKLEKQGYVTSRIEQQEGRPNKKLYDLTEEGKAIFLKWLTEFPENLTPISRNEFLVRIFFSSKLSDDELIHQLRRYIQKQQEDAKIYSTIEERLNSKISRGACNSEAFHQRFTVRRGLYFAQSEINWANECIEEITKLHTKG